MDLNSRDSKIMLNGNYRSGAKVLNGINSIFDTLMPATIGGLDYLSSRLNPQRDDIIDSEPIVHLVCDDFEENENEEDEVLEYTTQANKDIDKVQLQARLLQIG